MFLSKSLIAFHHFFRFCQIYVVLRSCECETGIGNDEYSLASEIIKMSPLVLAISFKDSNLFLLESMFDYAHNNWLTFARGKFFMTV